MSINLTLGAIVVLLAGLFLNFKSSKERQENGEWSSACNGVTSCAWSAYSAFCPNL